MKYGLLGIGQAGLRHFEAFKKIKNLKLIGFTEYDLKKANKFKKLNNIEHFNNINELIKLKPDFIVIALPHFLRIEPILECCKNNINLLIEKPLVLNSNELSSIKKYISKKNITHTISFVHRYRKEVFTAYKLIQDSKIGKIKFISETMISQKNKSLPKWIDVKKFSGGGVLLYNAIHSLDKISYLAKSKIHEVYAKKININNKIDVEDIISISMKFKNGITAQLIATFVPYETTPKWETKIFGTSGQIDINIRKGLELRSKNKITTYDYSKYYNKNGLNYNFYTQAKSYVDTLKKKTKPFIKIQDGINSVLVVDAIYKSININKVIKLKY